MYQGLMDWDDAMKAMTILKDWAPVNGTTFTLEARPSTIHGFWVVAIKITPTIPYTEGVLGFQVERMPDEYTLVFLTQEATDFIERCLDSN
jgi:hypothetical protein